MAPSEPSRRPSGAPRRPSRSTSAGRNQPADRRPSARRAGARRRHHRLVAVGGVTAAVIVAAALVVVNALTSSAPAASGGAGQPAPPAVVAAVTAVPVAEQAAAARTTPTVAPTALHGPALRTGGKPEVLYIGAEFCPFCAAERWALVAALSHFGTWRGLEVTHSSSTDSYPDTPTLSFRTATFTSATLSFRSVEETTNVACRPGSPGCAANGYRRLQQPTAAELALMASHDPNGDIPFVDLGGAGAVVGSAYSPQVLAGQSPEQVARDLGRPGTADAREIASAAAAITRTLCGLTGDQPAGACTSG